MLNLTNHSLTVHNNTPAYFGYASRFLATKTRRLRFDEEKYLKLLTTITQIENSAAKIYEPNKNSKWNHNLGGLLESHKAAIIELKALQQKYPESLRIKAASWDGEFASALAKLADLWLRDWVKYRMTLSLERSLLEKYSTGLEIAPQDEKQVFTLRVLQTRKHIVQLESFCS